MSNGAIYLCELLMSMVFLCSLYNMWPGNVRRPARERVWLSIVRGGCAHGGTEAGATDRPKERKERNTRRLRVCLPPIWLSLSDGVITELSWSSTPLPRSTGSGVDVRWGVTLTPAQAHNRGTDKSVRALHGFTACRPRLVAYPLPDCDGWMDVPPLSPASPVCWSVSSHSLCLPLCCLSVCLVGWSSGVGCSLVVVWLVRPSVQKMGRDKLDRSDERLGGTGGG